MNQLAALKKRLEIQTDIHFLTCRSSANFVSTGQKYHGVCFMEFPSYPWSPIFHSEVCFLKIAIPDIGFTTLYAINPFKILGYVGPIEA